MMMTDRELLELAAKAAGIFVTKEQFEKDCTSPWDPDWEVLEYNDEAKSITGWETIYSYSGELSGWGSYTWAPLADDGDALRLASVLGLFTDAAYEIHHCQKGDFAALRRAIVVTAAEIGKAMP